MSKYYINICPYNGRDPEVHVEGCMYLFLADERYTPLIGDFPDCHGAIEEAKKLFPAADGCAYCCTECDHDRTW